MANKALTRSKTKTPLKSEVKQKTVHDKSLEKSSNAFDFLKFGESYTSLVLGIIVVIIATILLLSFVHSKNKATVAVKDTLLSTRQIAPNSLKKVELTPLVTVKPSFFPSPTPTIAVKPSPTPKIKLNKITAVTPKSTITVEPTTKQLAVLQNPVRKNVNLKTTEKSYTVTSGDSLWSIAEKVYNNGYKWVEIARANNLNNPNLIHSGNKLVLPGEQTTQNIATTEHKNTSKEQQILSDSTSLYAEKITGREYKVVKGDTLWNVSVRAYGNGFEWTKIASANGLTNPSVIHSGNVLKIPRNT